jgi:hypothetical protein
MGVENEPLVSDYEIRKETASQLFLQKHRSVAANYGTMMKRKMAANDYGHQPDSGVECRTDGVAGGGAK